MSRKGPGGNEPWRQKDRHYCSVCNAWMGNDRQSISLHENGKKHREKVEEDLKKRREEKGRKEKEERELESVWRKVNEAAAGGSGVGVPSFQQPFIPAPVKSQPPPIQQTKKQQQSKPKADPVPSVQPKRQSKPQFDPSKGHYELEGTTYLEGQVYAPILEEGMPIQLWMGSPSACDDEKRDLRNFNYWKMAILASVKRKPKSGVMQGEMMMETTTCHVSYLQNATDEDETIETNVLPGRIRLVLGSDDEGLIPSTLEEAHLALMGGEQTIDVSNGNGDATTSEPQIDENTGLTTWSTTTIRKTSQHYEQTQERKRKRLHEKELAERKERKEKEIQARRMEEAKYENAHDSALGAYDVWSGITSASPNDATGGGSKGGGGGTSNYKGVDITKDHKVEVADTAKSLAKGMGSVAFKKKKVGKKNVRRTTADDD